MKPEACIRAAARAAKLDYVTLLHGRGRDAAAWRQVAIFIIRDSGCTTAQLAALFGRDVSTIRSSLQKIRRVESKDWFTDLVAKIKAEATDQISHDRRQRAQRGIFVWRADAEHARDF